MMNIHNFGRLSIIGVTAGACFLFALQESHAAVFNLQGSAGSFAPTQMVQSTDGTPISLNLPNILPAPTAGTRSATASGTVESGIIRLSAETAITMGATPIGSLGAAISGTWSDTLMFSSPGTIGGLEIVEGITPFVADLIFNLDGNLQRIDSGSTGNSDPQSSYSASLNYDNCVTGGCFTSQDGFWEGGGIDGSLVDEGVSDELAVSPDQLILTDVSGIFGVEFDLLFQLSINTKVEQGGTADADYIARALFGSTASWGGVQNVVANTAGGPITLEGPNILLTNSSGQDFSIAFETASPIPVPAAVWLFGTALIGLIGITRRRKS